MLKSIVKASDVSTERKRNLAASTQTQVDLSGIWNLPSMQVMIAHRRMLMMRLLLTWLSSLNKPFMHDFPLFICLGSYARRIGLCVDVDLASLKSEYQVSFRSQVDNSA